MAVLIIEWAGVVIGLLALVFEYASNHAGEKSAHIPETHLLDAVYQTIVAILVVIFARYATIDYLHDDYPDMISAIICLLVFAGGVGLVFYRLSSWRGDVSHRHRIMKWMIRCAEISGVVWEIALKLHVIGMLIC